MSARRQQADRTLHRLGWSLLALLASSSLAACSGTPVSPSPAVPPTSPIVTVPPGPGRVAIISIDGLRPDAILAVGAPNMLALAGRGSYSWRAQTILPSTTLPSHVSMLSGYTPDRHGMVWDNYSTERGPIPVPTLFNIARGVGRRTAMIAGKEKFTYFCETSACDVWAISTRGDDDVAGKVVSALGGDLIFVHLPDVDLTGHASSWMSDAYLAAVRRADQAVGRILSWLPSDTTVIVSADHGGHLTEHGSNDHTDVTIPWIIAGPRIVRARQLSSTIRTVDTAATAAYVMGISLDPSAAGRPVFEAFVSE